MEHNCEYIVKIDVSDDSLYRWYAKLNGQEFVCSIDSFATIWKPTNQVYSSMAFFIVEGQFKGNAIDLEHCKVIHHYPLFHKS